MPRSRGSASPTRSRRESRLGRLQLLRRSRDRSDRARAAGGRLPGGVRARPGERGASSRRSASAVEESELVRIGSRRTRRTRARSTRTGCACRSASRSARISPRARTRTSGSCTARARWQEIAALLVPPTGLRAVAALEPVLGADLLCAHCVEVDDGRDRAAGRPQRAGRALPPLERPARLRRSRRWRSCAPPGSRVGLGTDSPASTPSFDMFEEMRTADLPPGPASGAPRRSLADEALRLAPPTRPAPCESTARWVP